MTDLARRLLATSVALLLLVTLAAPASVSAKGVRQAASLPVTAIVAHDSHSCALLVDGTVRCWGRNSSGQLGDGTTSDRLTPVPVSGLTGAVAIGAGTCALLGDGTVRCWGWNAYGQLGDGTTTNRLTPVPVSGLTGVVAISAGYYHTCAALGDGTVRCWGNNSSGQLGDGTMTNRLTPVPVSGLTGVVAISAGYTHTCALLGDGTGRCWGDNSGGKLGDGTTTNRLTPVPVSGLTGVIAISASFYHTCAVLGDGSASCWGDNSVGELGDGTTTNRLTPVPVSGLTGALAVAVGYTHSCALLVDGTVPCWGASQLTPVPAPGLTGTVAMAFAITHSCGLFGDGSARCWGDNAYGQLGDGTKTSRSTPMPVLFPNDPQPTASFTAKWGPGGGRSVELDASGSRNAVRYRWNLDGVTRTETSARYTHTFGSSGEKQVRLTAIAADGTKSKPVTRTVTVDPVRTYAPTLWLDASETHYPDDADTYVRAAALWWAHSPCPIGGHRVKRAGEVDPPKLGSGAYTHERANNLCRHVGTPYTTKQMTAPRHSDNVLRGVGDGDEGFFLDGPEGMWDGSRALSSVPTYYEYRPNGWILYWFFYPYNDFQVIGKHEGDWENIAVKLDPRGVLTDVAYYGHGCYTPFVRSGAALEALVGDDAGFDAGTHPVGYVGAGSHATYGSTGNLACAQEVKGFTVPESVGAGTRWATWQGPLLDATQRGWYDFGGRWGTLDLVGSLDWGAERTALDGPTGPGKWKSRCSVPSAWTGESCPGETFSLLSVASQPLRPSVTTRDDADPAVSGSPTPALMEAPPPQVTPEPTHEPTADSTPEPTRVLEAEPTPEPEPSTEARKGPKTESESQAEGAPSSESKSEPEREPKPKADVEPEAKSEPGQEPKPKADTEPKADPDPKPKDKPQDKETAEKKPESDPTAQPPAEVNQPPTADAGPVPDPRSEATTEGRPGPDPESGGEASAEQGPDHRYQVDEGGSVELDGSSSVDPDGSIVAYLWTREPRLDDATAKRPLFTAVDDGLLDIGLTVTDDLGASDTDRAEIRVHNVDPRVAELGPFSVSVGEELVLSGIVIRDPGPEDTHELSLDWGDGTSSAAVVHEDRSATASHVYVAPGEHVITLTVRDDDGGTGSQAARVSVLAVSVEEGVPAGEAAE